MSRDIVSSHVSVPSKARSQGNNMTWKNRFICVCGNIRIVDDSKYCIKCGAMMCEVHLNYCINCKDKEEKEKEKIKKENKYD